MRDVDFDAFTELLDSVCGLLSRGVYQPSAANSAMFFRALGKYDLADVRKALDAHVSDTARGRFVPVPADVIAQIEGRAAADGRPGADEAWATALKSADERETVVWTDEAAEAWAVARPVFDRGDEIGARMAFRDAYNRVLEHARAALRPARWFVSEGFDIERRVLAVERAVRQGLLPKTELVALPAPAGMPLLAGPDTDLSAPARAAREKLRALVAAKSIKPGLDAIAKERTAELKAETAARVEAYTKENSHGAHKRGVRQDRQPHGPRAPRAPRKQGK